MSVRERALPRTGARKRTTARWAPELWRRPVDGDAYLVGLRRSAAVDLGSIDAVGGVSPGTDLRPGEVAVTLEVSKCVITFGVPVAGRVVRVNPAILEDPSLVLRDPTGSGWLFQFRLGLPRPSLPPRRESRRHGRAPIRPSLRPGTTSAGAQ